LIVLLRLAADYEVLEVLVGNVIKLLSGKIISNIFSVRGYRTLKPRSKFISKNLRKLGFNIPVKKFFTKLENL